MHFMYPSIDVKKTNENIFSLLEANNISLSDLQNILGFSSLQAIYKWKWGKSIPSLDNLVIISKLVNTPLDKILVIRQK